MHTCITIQLSFWNMKAIGVPQGNYRMNQVVQLVGGGTFRIRKS